MMVYVIYSIDYPYLPVAVFDTQIECAKYLRMSAYGLNKYIKDSTHVYRSKYLVIQVFLEEDLTTEDI